MAQFVEDVPTVAADYTRNSQGYKADTSIGGLFGDAADILTNTVKAGAQLLKDQIRSEETAGVDDIRNAELDRGAEALGYGTRQKTPAELERSLERAKFMTEAKAAGTIGGSHYDLVLDAEARRMRARYPGHREYIDQVMSDLTGMTPANHAIAQMRAETNKEGREASKSAAIAWAMDPKHGGPFNEGRKYIEAAGINVDLSTLLKMNARTSAQLAVQEDTLRNINFDEKNKAATEKDYERVAGKALFNSQFGAARAGLAGAGVTYEKLQSQIAEIDEARAQNKPISAEAEQQVRAGIAKFEQERATEFDRIMFEPHTETDKDGNKRTFNLAQRIGEGKIDALWKNYDIRTKNLVKPLRDKDTGALTTNASHAQAATDATVADIMASEPFFVRQGAYAKVLSPQLAAAQINRSPQGLRVLQKFHRDYIIQGLGTDENHTDSLTKSTEIMRKSGMSEEDIAKTNKAATDVFIESLRKPDITPRDRAAIVKHLFGDGSISTSFYGKQTPDKRDELYGKLLDPTITQHIYDNTDPATISRYEKWADQAAAMRIQQGATDTSNVLRTNSRYGIQFNQVTSQFEHGRNENFDMRTEQALRGGTPAGDYGMQMAAERLIRDLNKSVNHYKPIAEAKGEDVNEYIAKHSNVTAEAVSAHEGGDEPEKPSAPPQKSAASKRPRR